MLRNHTQQNGCEEVMESLQPLDNEICHAKLIEVHSSNISSHLLLIKRFNSPISRNVPWSTCFYVGILRCDSICAVEKRGASFLKGYKIQQEFGFREFLFAKVASQGQLIDLPQQKPIIKKVNLPSDQRRYNKCRPRLELAPKSAYIKLQYDNVNKSIF